MYHDKYHFLWNDFTTHLSSMFRDLAQSSEYADVTLVSDDRKQSYAHKFVLSACSPCFQDDAWEKCQPKPNNISQRSESPRNRIHVAVYVFGRNNN